MGWISAWDRQSSIPRRGRAAPSCGAKICGAKICGAKICGAKICGAKICGAKTSNSCGHY
jgi:hypothetical protein